MKDSPEPSRPGETNAPPPAAGGDWPEKIERVLARRKPYGAWLAGAEKYLGELQAGLEEVARQKSEMAGDAALRPHLEGADFGGLARRAAEQRRFLEELGRRFRRETLNIAVVGMVNQGKSFLLRTLSGLPPTVIPDRGSKHSQHDPLTGARSTIIHEAGGKITGRVIFYTEAELLEILNSYRAELLAVGGPGADSALAPPYASVAQFVQRPAPGASQAANMPTRYNSLVKQLQKYRQTLASAGQLVGRPPLDGLAEGQIVQYVTQNAGAQGGAGAHLHLLVREVQIACEFPYDRVGKIALIDLPGLGEATLGGPERLWRTLRLDADVALFVWRPMKGNLVEGNDFIGLYDTCYQAMKETLPLHEWSFLVLNHDRTVNDHLQFCEGTLKKIREKESLFKFFSERICDCSSPEEVREEVLSPVLAHLAQHMGELDRRVAASCADGIEALTRDAAAALRRVYDSFGGSGDDWDEREFGRLFNERWDGLRLELNNLVLELKRKADEPDETFTRRVGGALNECAEVHRSLKPEEGQAEIDRETSFDLVFIGRMIRARAEISSRLRALDSALDQPLAAVKERVARVFGARGGFGGLDGQGGLELLRDRLKPHSPALRQAFDNLIDFRMSARGLIGYKVRTKLQALEPRRSPQEPLPPNRAGAGAVAAAVAELAPEVRLGVPGITIGVKTDKGIKVIASTLAGMTGGGGGGGGADIRRDLGALISDTLDEIGKSLSEDYSRPNQVAYAIVADFVDSVVHAGGAEDEWRNVYRSLRESVWPSDYEQQRRQQVLREGLRAGLQRALGLMRDGPPALPAA